jgi:hypothetical protein
VRALRRFILGELRHIRFRYREYRRILGFRRRRHRSLALWVVYAAALLLVILLVYQELSSVRPCTVSTINYACQ